MGYVINKNNGRPVENAEVQVQDYGTVNASTIYADDGGVTEAGNPVGTDENGYYEYFAENGRYTEIVTTNDDEQTLSDILIEAPPLRATKDYDPPGLSSGDGAFTLVTVAGAALGDQAIAAFSLGTSLVMLDAQVTAADTVSVRFQNQSGSTVQLQAGTVYVTVYKHTGL
jgi:hypothetical protein